MDKRLRWTWVLVLGLALVGCGGDDDGGNEDAGPGDSGTAGTGTSGSGSGGGGGTGGTTVAEPVPCGSEMCEQPMSLTGGMMLPIPIPIPMPVACCLDEATSECGTMAMAGATCEPPAEPDTRCPSIDLSALEAFLGGAGGGFGCCTAMNQCGVDGMAFGRGCVENGEASAMLSGIPLIGTLFMIPEARACDDVSTDDGGTDSDGGN